MISLTALVIVGVILLALLLAGIFVPNPITWIMTLLLGAVFWFVLLPKYQGEQQAVTQGVVVRAAVSEVRSWSRKQGDGDYQDWYEVLAMAANPETGKLQTFVSAPMKDDPAPYLGETVEVKVDWRNPKAYVMDLSFLPNPPK
ncbi:hypothetical protein [Neisseria leonii]|uniref:hypothetical protein n=1 Tax=Neisseria leonii TaxID=2995413 RepID=UPI00237BBCE0|nr:hypothetical protein [Neisseria sp. 3986]MDD9325851.1 hypothetical protein [Neisseria sp. 3986]